MSAAVTLLPGDCLTLLPTLPPASVDLVLADLPYGTTACKWDCPLPLDVLWREYKRILSPRGAVVLTASQPFTSALVMSNPAWFRHEWIWDKKRCTNGANAHRAPMKAHESVLVFARYAPLYHPQMGSWENITLTRRKPALTKKSDSFSHADHYSPGRDEKLLRGRYPDSVLRIPALGSWDQERVGHATQKPVALGEYLIRTYTDPGMTVLDNTMGVGSFGVAAVQTGRAFIGMELDPGYYAVATERIAAARYQPPAPTQPALLAAG